MSFVDPHFARILLGRKLRDLRERHGMTPRQAFRALGWSPAKLSRIECGRSRLALGDLEPMLELYEADDAEVHALRSLAGVLERGSWWDDYDDLLSPWFRSYLILESVTDSLWTYEMRYVPGLLQTASYAAAVIRLHHPDEFEVRRRVAVRMQRQRRLIEPGGPRLHAVIDEAALHEGIGTAEVMQEQRLFLFHAANRENIDVSVLPAASLDQVPAGDSFTVLRMRGRRKAEISYLEHLYSADFHDEPHLSKSYRDLWKALSTHSRRLL